MPFGSLSKLKRVSAEERDGRRWGYTPAWLRGRCKCSHSHWCLKPHRTHDDSRAALNLVLRRTVMYAETVNKIVFGDNLDVLRGLPDGTAQLIYIDPPFNTGKVQKRTRLRTIHDEAGGDRTGFQGKRYRTVKLGESGYVDVFDNYLEFLEPRLREAHRILRPEGSLFFHIDYREVHYCKILLDLVFGRESFQNEIIWAYDYGARSKSRWPAKHDNILWFAKDPDNFVFRFEEMDRIPYMAPGLVGPEKAAIGKTPTDTWWHTIVSPNGKEKTGYATQKPLGIVERIVKVHSHPGDLVIDFFAGSGTAGEAAAKHGRKFLLVDDNPEAIRVMAKRLGAFQPELVNCDGVLAHPDGVEQSDNVVQPDLFGAAG